VHLSSTIETLKEEKTESHCLTVSIENQTISLCTDACLSGDVSLRCALRKILRWIALFTNPVVKLARDVSQK